MYFSRLRPRPGAEKSPDFWRALGDGYQLHQLLWSHFGDAPERKRDFIYRVEMTSGLPTFYVVSARPPRSSEGPLSVECKDYDPRIEEGRSFLFSLKANPVVSKRDEDDRQHRHDVVMEAKQKLRAADPGNEAAFTAGLIQEAGAAWLEERMERSGFMIKPEEIRVDGYRQHVYQKPKARGAVRFSTLDFHGRLRVTDAGRFKETLYLGLGPAKAYGCGLLLIRRA
ncbi:MAG: type I-E CRISPR-associated protein Cas6/Cse3/CasE [Thermodesulfobacteriota bacterium]